MAIEGQRTKRRSFLDLCKTIQICYADARGETMQDTLTMTEAAKRLGITRVTLGRLVREGKLPTMENPLDKRQRLIPVAAIERLQGRSGAGRRPRPRTLGSVSDPELRSDQIEDYIETRWKRE